MIIVYFSGTGNSKYLAEQFAKRMNINAYSIEQNLDFETIFSHEDTIAFCYPIYGSCVPRIMREFVSKYKFYLNEKKLDRICLDKWRNRDSLLFVPTKAVLAADCVQKDVPLTTWKCRMEKWCKRGIDVAQDILTDFHPWMKSIFFEADRELIKLSKIAVKKTELTGKVFWGRMVTGKSFITDEGRQKINDEFAPLTVDMETASIAHVCYVNDIPFLSIRCVTDTAEHSGVGNFEENCAKASTIAKNITTALLRAIGGM